MAHRRTRPKIQPDYWPMPTKSSSPENRYTAINIVYRLLDKLKYRREIVIRKLNIDVG